ncbi:MAG: hypothetical protein ACD_63C00077G0005, partial [uncultured bacterium]
MASTKDIKRRIRSISNTQKITKAMEMVAASKMRRSQRIALQARAYAGEALSLITDLAKGEAAKSSELMEERDVKNVCFVIVSTNKGLAGGINSNLFREALKYIEKEKAKNRRVSVVAIGKKGSDFALRTDLDLAAEFLDVVDKTSSQGISPILKIVEEGFVDKKFDKVCLVYTEFISTLNQKPVVRQLLPVTKDILVIESQIGKDDDLKGKAKVSYLVCTFEPSKEEVLESLLPEFIRMQIYYALLESQASEHSARMVAMQSASKNAGEMIGDLTL